MFVASPSSSEYLGVCQGLTDFSASFLGAVDLRFSEGSCFFRSTLRVWPDVVSVVRSGVPVCKDP